MSNIINLNEDIVITRKRAHDPEKVEAARRNMNNELGQCMAGYENDLLKDPLGATFPDEAAAFNHWDGEWRKLCARRAQSDMPVLYNENAFTEGAAKMKEQRQRDEEMAMLVSKVPDLAAWDLKLVGQCELGSVWIADRFAIVVDVEGMVLLLLREKGESLMSWSERAWLDAATWEKARELPELVLGDLFTLLRILRCEKIGRMPEPLMAIARCDDPMNAQPK